MQTRKEGYCTFVPWRATNILKKYRTETHPSHALLLAVWTDQSSQLACTTRVGCIYTWYEHIFMSKAFTCHRPKKNETVCQQEENFDHVKNKDRQNLGSNRSNNELHHVHHNPSLHRSVIRVWFFVEICGRFFIRIM